MRFASDSNPLPRAPRTRSLRNFVNYGLEHWGSDQSGVNHTRRFLLEWLAFLHRYIPLGLLERGAAQKIGDRCPALIGARDDLEFLMASPDAGDWVKISEMLLGPVPADFRFVPKHKSSESYEGSGAGAKRAREGDDDEGEAEG